MLDDKRDVDAFGALLERLETIADRLEEVDGDIARIADALEASTDREADSSLSHQQERE